MVCFQSQRIALSGNFDRRFMTAKQLNGYQELLPIEQIELETFHLVTLSRNSTLIGRFFLGTITVRVKHIKLKAYYQALYVKI